jgi:hypothetical protein
MATKADILTILGTVYEDNAVPEIVADESWNGKTKKTYKCNVQQVEGNRWKFKNVNFYVLNEGEVDETAGFDLTQNYTELVV